MNIHVPSYLISTTYYVRERFLLVLTDQHKKIIALASLIFACLAAGFLVGRYYFQAKPLSDAQGVLNGRGKRFCGKEGDSIAEGEFDEGLLNGQGQVTSSQGDLYIGVFEKGDLKVGEIILLNGKIEKQINRRSIIEYSGKMTFQGSFKNNELHGQGNIKFSNGDVWHGEFREGELEGKGWIIFRNGHWYTEKWEGEFQRDKLNGPGRKINFYGSVDEEGVFKDGDLHGEGKSVNKHRIKEGIFEKGRLSKGTINWLTLNAIAEGAFFENKWIATITYSSGEVWEGEFNFNTDKDQFEKEDELIGKVIDVNGVIAEGCLTFSDIGENIELNRGKKTYPDGRIEDRDSF